MEEAPAYDRVSRQGAAVKLATKKRTSKLYAGDLVEVRTPLEILRTLDSDGTLGGLPFMPEMIGFCGKRFRVSSRVLKTCVSIAPSTTMRVFKTGDIVTLDGPRCSGVDHDGCQKACLIFWREAWLRKPEDSAAQPNTGSDGQEQLRIRLKASTSPDTYFCQASELLKVTDPLPRSGRFGKCFTDVWVGNCGVWQMAQRIGIWLFWKIREAVSGVRGKVEAQLGPVTSTPRGRS